MNKLFTFILSLFLTFTITSTDVQAQQFDYEGTYLTTDTTQQIQGFHFDPDNHRMIVIPFRYSHNSDIDTDGIKNYQRLQNIIQYEEEHLDLSTLSQEEMANFNETYGIDYAEALRNVAHSDFIKENSSNNYLNLLLLLQSPGIHNLGTTPFIHLTLSDHANYNLIVINQPDFQFNQSLWEVSMFDIKTPLLRFEASNDKQTITDDFGITYEKQESDYEFYF